MKELTRNDGFDECLSGVIYQELLPDFNEQLTALWSYCFSDNEIERKEWRASYEEAQKNVWQSYPF